ncbi:BLUF domain-containing protein, partial [Microcoleus sp. C2C3]|uniref:BLUF domain-containing protein n=1 Tax=Microcoleus sp. C2C3 TaxID=3055324 RepID=UPI002FD466B1
MSLYRLVYYSANRIPSANEHFRSEVDQILAKSRRNNALVDLTGALMFSAGYFGQVLEGPQAAIEATFERIQQDPRHGDVSLLEFVPVAARSFDKWAMAYVGEQTGVVDAAYTTGFDPDRITGDALLSKLKAMVSSDSLTAY